MPRYANLRKKLIHLALDVMYIVYKGQIYTRLAFFVRKSVGAVLQPSSNWGYLAFKLLTSGAGWWSFVSGQSDGSQGKGGKHLITPPQSRRF